MPGRNAGSPFHGANFGGDPPTRLLLLITGVGSATTTWPGWNAGGSPSPMLMAEIKAVRADKLGAESL